MLRVMGLTPLCAGLRGSGSVGLNSLLVFVAVAVVVVVVVGGASAIANGLSVNSVARGDMRASPKPSNVGSVTFVACDGSAWC